MIRFRKHRLAHLNRPHKETAKNYFHRALYAGAAYVLSRWYALAAAYMAAGAAYGLTRLYIGRVICREPRYRERLVRSGRLYREPVMANRLNREPLIWCRLYREPLI